MLGGRGQVQGRRADCRCMQVEKRYFVKPRHTAQHPSVSYEATDDVNLHRVTDVELEAKCFVAREGKAA